MTFRVAPAHAGDLADGQVGLLEQRADAFQPNPQNLFEDRVAQHPPETDLGQAARGADVTHDIRHADALVDEMEAMMRAGDGALSWREDV